LDYLSYCFLDVAYFSDALAKYNSEEQMATAIKENRNIGMMLVDTTKLKEVLIPSPLKCLDVSTFHLIYFDRCLLSSSLYIIIP